MKAINFVFLQVAKIVKSKVLVVKGSNFTHSDQFLSTFKFHFPSDKPLKRKSEDQPA